ncbi:MAG TPA: DUF4833 domain-containing protein [Bacteroidetes bacterium]|nr:DUF4833 domain-containing protein [Bacteroidota bacterium]
MKYCSFVFLLTFFTSTFSFGQDLENGRPADFPIPSNIDNFLFFIQRNQNENTIVYVARLDKDGNFQKSKPAEVYWLRYASENGKRRELGWLERTFAYGFSSKKDKGGNGYWIELTAYDGRKIHLEMDAQHKPIATITCNGRYSKLDYIWVFVDEERVWPHVLHVDIHATDMETGEELMERIENK